MFQIGVFCKDDEQVTEIANLISNKLSISPNHCMRGLVEFYSNMLRLVIITCSRTRGYRFDVGFYDKSIENDIVEMVILPQCYGCARNIEELKWRL